MVKVMEEKMKRTFDPNTVCACGKVHKTMVEHRLVKSGAINDLPEYLKLYTLEGVCLKLFDGFKKLVCRHKSVSLVVRRYG